MNTITVSQAAQLAGCTGQHIRDEIAAGRLPAIKIDPRNPNSPFIIRRRDFDRWLKAQKPHADA